MESSACVTLWPPLLWANLGQSVMPLSLEFVLDSTLTHLFGFDKLELYSSTSRFTAPIAHTKLET